MSSALIIILFLSFPVGLLAWSIYRLAESFVAAMRAEEEEETRFSGTLVELANQKRRELTNLKVVELDYETGKVSGPHYEAYRKAAKERLVSIMRRQDQIKEGFVYTGQIEEALENLSLENPAQKAPYSGENPAGNVLLDSEEAQRLEQLAAASSRGEACPECGEDVDEQDRFCAQCGHPLRAD
mgnify:CR=1 FL=1